MKLTLFIFLGILLISYNGICQTSTLKIKDLSCRQYFSHDTITNVLDTLNVNVYIFFKINYPDSALNANVYFKKPNLDTLKLQVTFEKINGENYISHDGKKYKIRSHEVSIPFIINKTIYDSFSECLIFIEDKLSRYTPVFTYNIKG